MVIVPLSHGPSLQYTRQCIVIFGPVSIIFALFL